MYLITSRKNNIYQTYQKKQKGTTFENEINEIIIEFLNIIS